AGGQKEPRLLHGCHPQSIESRCTLAGNRTSAPGAVGDTGWVAQTLLDTPALTEAVERSADPTAARALLTRLLEEHPALADELAPNPLLREALAALSAASRSLSNAVTQDPSLLDPLRDGDGFERERELSAYRESAAEFLAAADDGAGALRRWKRRELLRIAA